VSLLELANEVDLSATPTVLVAALGGLSDLGFGATAAAAALREQFSARPIAWIDTTTLYDDAERRPTMTVDRWRLADLSWPELTLELLEPPAGPALALLTGPEPSRGWRRLVGEVIDLARGAGITRYVGLGSYPGPTPHTRQVRMLATSSERELAERIGHPQQTFVAPAAFQLVLEHQLTAAGLTTLGLWAQVPHYVSGAYPEASRALLERLSAHLGAPVDLAVFDAAISDVHEELQAATTSSPDGAALIDRLERLHDAEVADEPEGGDAGAGGDIGPVPSGDVLAEQIERFLRGGADPT
jgi:hypothetical protein